MQLLQVQLDGVVAHTLQSTTAPVSSLELACELTD
jgi:hypothetical protein